ncbi:recombinase family protein [Streptococcus pluranimalium]|nr:recombinase family protein [Streptococcus pluranimalium]
MPQYYVENNHEAIFDRETFDAVQLVLDKKKSEKQAQQSSAQS